MMNTNKDQVVISFRGKDLRNGFLTHLKQKLVEGKVNVFTDDNLTGQPIQNIFGHIGNSKIAIVIFSKNYAESDWCFDELVEIKNCFEMKKLNAVIPIFYKVKVSSIKKQSGKFGVKFHALQNSLLGDEVDKKKVKHIKSRIKRWNKALEIVTEIAGLRYYRNSPENVFVEKIVKEVNTNLARIAAEEGRNSNTDPETSKTSLEKELTKELNQTTFNISQLNVNIIHHRSRSFEAPSLSWNPEGYNKSIDLKLISGAIKRNASFLDNIGQLGPYPFEAMRVQTQVENPQSNDKKVENKYRGGTNNLSSLLYCFSFGCILVLVMQRFRRNETSIARN